ncbi:MAG: hypothetical protein R3B72_16940 [Polyangiaceae bacterium]
MRLRHEWLATPLKKKRVKRRSALRVGLYDAWERNGKTAQDAPEAADAQDADKTDG